MNLTHIDALWIEIERGLLAAASRAALESRILAEEAACRLADLLRLVGTAEQALERRHHCLIELLKSDLARRPSSFYGRN